MSFIRSLKSTKKPMRCAKCGRDCTDEYYILDIKCIKDGQLYLADENRGVTVLCDDCYLSLLHGIGKADSREF